MKDGVSWQLEADQAETYEKAGRTVLRKVRIRIQEPERSWTVTGDEGEMVQATKDVELRGNVVLISSDGLRLETTRLRWDADAKRAWTDEPVILLREGRRGEGLGARRARGRAEHRRSRAAFGRRSAGAGRRRPRARGRPLAGAPPRGSVRCLAPRSRAEPMTRWLAAAVLADGARGDVGGGRAGASPRRRGLAKPEATPKSGAPR